MVYRSGLASGSRVTFSAAGLAALLLAAAAGAAPPAAALETRTGDAINVPAGTTIDDDLVAAGQSIAIAGGVTGDVFAFGSTITITGTIDRDLIAAGQRITIDGVVRGDLRAAAQDIVINGRVEGNVSTGSQHLSVDNRGRIDGSLLGGAQNLYLQGDVGRGVTAAATTLQLGGAVGGDVQANVDHLVVDPSARIAGRLSYRSEDQVSVPNGTVAGGVQFQQAERRDRERERNARRDFFAGLFGFFNLVWLVGSVIAGVLLVHFLPGFAAGTVAQVRERPLPSLGLGVLALFVVPVAILLVAFTLIGLPIAFVAGLGYLLALYAGWLLLGLAVGVLLVDLVRRRNPTLRADPRWLVVLGLIVLYVLTHLPWIGGLASFAAVCLGLGALLLQVAAARRSPAAPLPPPGALPPV
jgi:cytoskeletal protein CcmA (bactofilin family)